MKREVCISGQKIPAAERLRIAGMHVLILTTGRNIKLVQLVEPGTSEQATISMSSSIQTGNFATYNLLAIIKTSDMTKL